MKTYLAHSLLSSHSCAHTVRAYVGMPTYDKKVETRRRGEKEETRRGGKGRNMSV